MPPGPGLGTDLHKKAQPSLNKCGYRGSKSAEPSHSINRFTTHWHLEPELNRLRPFLGCNVRLPACYSQKKERKFRGAPMQERHRQSQRQPTNDPDCLTGKTGMLQHARIGPQGWDGHVGGRDAATNNPVCQICGRALAMIRSFGSTVRGMDYGVLAVQCSWVVGSKQESEGPEELQSKKRVV